MNQAANDTPDLLLRFLLPSAGVRGVAVRLDDTWRAIAGHGDYPPAVAGWLGQATAAAALFASHAKVDGRLSVQLRGNGALRTLFAECTAAGTLRGIARLDDAISAAPASLRGLGDDALLAITIENPSQGGREPMRYQGLVALETDDLATAFEGYFRQSEQLPTRLLLASDGHQAAGLLLQKLPGDGGDEDGWNRACALFETLRQGELLDTAPAVLVHRLFHQEAPQVLASQSLRFACSCSLERVEGMLVSLGTAEAAAAVAAGDGAARIGCEFCGQHYQVDAERMAELFRRSALQLADAPGVQ
jgi:molecular chaperone Hsp33